MEGRNDADHLNWLAEIAAKAIYEAFTGYAWEEDFQRGLTSTKPKDTHLESHDISSSAASRLEALTDAYRSKDMGTLFEKLKVNVPWERL